MVTGRKLGFTIDLGKLHNVSLGQGQEAVAEVAMEMAAKEGHWVILQNIHLVARWLGSLEKLLERCCEGSHQDYRVFMSAEPAPTPQEHIIPQGILENAIKITNEPPTGMHANLHAALDNFDQDILDQCRREQEFKTILFSLCYFHACVAERRKFGPQGWNRKYPFNTGDLTISVNVLYNYLEANSQVPWEDLRYLFGEIMYGGHITDDWDRRLCRTYLEEYMQPNQFDRKLALAPGFVVPSNLDYQGYHGYVDEMLPHESPVHYGLHPNAEIEFLTVTSDNLFHTLLELQSPDSVMGEGASQTVEEKVKTILDEVLEKLPEEYNMSDIYEIRRSLKELDLGLKGELAISSEMEQIQSALFFDNVPDTWTKLAYPSTYSLAQWYNDVLLRCRELDSWTQDLALPTVVWLSGLFNPQSFLTAVMQSLARKNEWPLDKMNLTVDVTKKFKEEFNQPAREGAYVYGLYMQGARWDTQGGVITEARLKELTPSMPVISVRAVPNDRQETRNIYECPLYKTKLRGTTYVWTFSLKTRERPAKNFVEEKLGVKYTEGRKTEFAKSFRESGPASPVFFILSPGVDPLKDVESLGRKLGFTIDLGKLHNVSLGQGQEAVAEVAMEMAAKEGHWVILQNIHLVARWLGSLEKLLERCCEGSHQDYRVFISAEPAPTPQEHIIPQGILENAIKITNEPPTGMHANLHAALDNFDQDILDQCSREQEFKTILFSLCYFHACVAERRKFGPQGWNRKYPFNTGDLTISVNVLYNYLEANSQVPWEDLRYLFGEIVYGGHITDDWDRRLCRTYLEEYMQPNQFDRKLALAPGFVVPSNLDYQGYHGYVDEMLPHESPVHYGLHPNAEIEFLTVTSDNLFHTLLELQSPDSVMGEGASQTVEEKVKTILDEVLEKLPEEYNMSDITSKTAERSPYILVCFQECERMNTLIYEIRRSLKELDLGLKGELAISSEMEQIQSALFFDNVPDTWTKLAYPSTYSLAQWYNDVLLRCRELDSWTQDLALPTVVWLSGLFNPQSFLTAVMQSLARKNEWPLDKMNLTVDVTKKFKEEFNQPAREGAYVYGLYMEGARWDTQGGVITEARLKELTPSMPVISVRAVPNDRQEMRNIYECPLYKTKLRGTTYVWTFSLKTRERPAKWVLAGVALLLSV
ncbi:LOW QUALITY PROTEIN: dynein axonemal heavy chain 11-like [Coregonus clupeaformis]|uniref:LOW QUALITY PROTEIN: dynein axonemal heavy chain 11-like n=1 Tax=Coregonus clupeaformis TaxID=59861 RepID=UPI001E1C2D80|nr:LOW QUALITY PROTEIN: dynein axonemal heavy chain 11-like [Coregonus clupeaformis]